MYSLLIYFNSDLSLKFPYIDKISQRIIGVIKEVMKGIDQM